MITGGGTGGHVYPALSVLERLEPRPALLWVGKEGGMEAEILNRRQIPYEGIPAGGLADLSWRTRLSSVARLMQGFRRAWTLLRGFRPDVLFATGGYVTVPVGLAAWLQRVPIGIYLPDIVPGLAVRALAPLATKIAVTTPETAHRFGKRAVVTGYPVRGTLAAPKSRAAARAHFDLPEDERVLLVTGGSQGSHSLNEAIGMYLPDYLALGRVIHVHGQSDGAWLRRQREALPEAQRARYLLYEYLHDEMADALLAADLVVARAGASVLGEFTAAALPAVLVPLPATGVNQQANADWVAARGGAVVLPDSQARARLLPLVRDLLQDEGRLRAMAAGMRAAAHPQAAAAIARMLLSLALERPGAERIKW